MVNSTFRTARTANVVFNNTITSTSSINSNSTFATTDIVFDSVISQLLRNVGSDFQAYFSLFANNQIDQLSAAFDLEKYTSIAYLLHKSRGLSSSDEYAELLDILSNSITGLYKAVLNKREYDLKIAELQRIIDQLRGGGSGFGAESLRQVTELSVVATIKPEIIEYIRIYGYPENNNFDAEKLALIVEQMNEVN